MSASERADDIVPSHLSGPVRKQFDWTEITPSTAVAETIAAAAECEPIDFGPLYPAVDMDTIDKLLRNSAGDSDVCVSFTAIGFAVRLTGDGELQIRPADDAE